MLFTQYPLGWPLVILLGKLVRWPELSLVVAAGLAVLGTYVLAREITHRRRIAALAGTLYLASPIVAVQGGVYLTYLFATGLGTLFAALVLAGVRRGSRWRVAGAGALLGAMVATRTYDAVVWAAAVGGFVAVVERRRWRELLRLAPPFLAALVPIVALQLVHNWWLTGRPTTFPITVADPLDRFGFGDRRLMPRLEPVDYTPRRAVVGTLKHLFFMPWFVFGAYLGAAVAVFGVWRERAERGTWMLLALCAAFPLAYFPFWGVHVSSLTTRISGPIYYIPVYVPVCVLMAIGLVWAMRRLPRTTAAAVCVALVATVPVAIGRLGLNRELGQIQAAWAESTAQVDGPALVVVSPSPYLLFLHPASNTRADVAADITFVTDTDPSLIDLIEGDERPALLQRASLPALELVPSEHPKRYDVEVVPLEVVRGDTLQLDIATTSAQAGVASIAVSVGGDAVWKAASAPIPAGEPYRQTMRLGGESLAVDRDSIVVPEGGTKVDITVGFGASASEAEAEPSVRYRFLIDRGPTLRALQPGRFYRLDRTDPEDLRWRDDVDRGDLEVNLRPRPGV